MSDTHITIQYLIHAVDLLINMLENDSILDPTLMPIIKTSLQQAKECAQFIE